MARPRVLWVVMIDDDSQASPDLASQLTTEALHLRQHLAALDESSRLLNRDFHSFLVEVDEAHARLAKTYEYLAIMKEKGL